VTVCAVARAEQLLAAEGRHNDELVVRIERLERTASETAERQRELHVLLLHRDEELVRLHEYLRSTRGLAEPPALPEPEEAEEALAAPVLPLTVEQRVLAKLTTDAVTAAGWLNRILTRNQPRT
jgi:hypothetical protein